MALASAGGRAYIALAGSELSSRLVHLHGEPEGAQERLQRDDGDPVNKYNAGSRHVADVPSTKIYCMTYNKFAFS